ncbi:glutamate mutase L [Pseudonocardia nematodicida]|uniref:Glutamate mutase L n=1 Tax=Pseudonocardia nematodicida TaxID=1206997 RepID=A0ABV1K8C9_9PSEU
MTDPRPGAAEPTAPAVCLDVGSCWTKAVLVRPDGTPAGFAEHPTTPDVRSGIEAAVAAAAASAGSGAAAPEVLSCSSAGGPLRLAVVGTERLTTEEAGHRVCHSAGARVVSVHDGPLDTDAVRALARARPGAVLLLGGPDGGDPGVLLHNAGRLARGRGPWTVLLAVDAAARDDALGLLRAGGRTVTPCPNVTPRRGEIVAGPVRDAVADLYARQVPGPARQGEPAPTRTTEAVAAGAAVLARGAGTGVLVVDVGSETTDVHAGDPYATTVEGDLGIRAAAEGVLVGAQTEGVVDPVEADLLGPAAAALASAGPSVPADRGEAAEERRLAAVAAVVALRRHLRHRGLLGHEHPLDRERSEIGLVVLTGGVFRQRDAAGLAAAAATVRHDPALAVALAAAEVRIDVESVLAPAGLLARHGREAAARELLRERFAG